MTKKAKSNPLGNSFYNRLALTVAALAAATITSYAGLIASFGTEYKGANPDGTHRWETAITNLSPHASSDYAIFELDIDGKLADNNVGTDKFWDLLCYENQEPNPQDNKFTVGTSDPDEYLLPQQGGLFPFQRIMKINYTTPADFDHLAEGTIHAYSKDAGEIDITGQTVIPEPAVAGLIGLFGAGMLLARRLLAP